VNYLGGGPYYNIVLTRHKRNIYSALRDENIMSIANPTPAYVYVTDKISDVIKLMLDTGIGLIPVLWPDNSVYGVITEHDLVKHIAGKTTGVRVEDIATRTLITVEIEATIKDAAKIMVENGFRRLPVVNPVDSSIKGVISAKEIVSYFGGHDAFKHLTSTDIEEVLKTPVYELMRPGVYTVSKDADVGDVARHMLEYGVNFLLVENENEEIIGIVTERDVLSALLE
jgi:CBS domain-containing protein